MEFQWPEHFQPSVVRSGFGAGTVSTHTLALEAWRRGLKVTFLAPSGKELEVSDGARTVRFDRSRAASEISEEAYSIVESKYDTTAALRAAGVPVPEAFALAASETTFEEVRAHAESLGYPVVLKPMRGSRGRGVFANIQSVEQLQEYYTYLVDDLGSEHIVLERHHFGGDYRAFVVGDRFIAACQRIPARVSGDGTHTVGELIDQKNRLRRQNPFLSGGLIAKDYEVRSMVAQQGLTMDSVPLRDADVQLRQKANASAGGDVVDVTDAFPEHMQAAAVSAVSAIPGLPAAGVDILWDPDNAGGRETEFVIIEMNSRAHIGVNMYPTHGRGRDVPEAVIDNFFPGSRRPSTAGAEMLTFDRADLLQPILNGTAASVELNPLPEHGLPVRRQCRLAAGLSLPPALRRKIRSEYRRAGVSGRLVLREPEPRLVVAGEEKSVREWFRRIARVLGEEFSQVEEYTGPVHLGFGVSE